MSDNIRALTEYSEANKKEIKESQASKVFSLGDIRLYECPVSYLLADEDMVALRRMAYQADAFDVLLFEGALAEQPFWFIETLELLKYEEAREVRKRSGGKKS